MSWYLVKVLEDDLDDPGFGAEARLAGYDRPCSRCGPRERAEEAHAGTWRARRVIGGRGRGCRAGSARGPGERVERRGRGVGEAPVGTKAAAGEDPGGRRRGARPWRRKERLGRCCPVEDEAGEVGAELGRSGCRRSLGSGWPWRGGHEQGRDGSGGALGARGRGGRVRDGGLETRGRPEQRR